MSNRHKFVLHHEPLEARRLLCSDTQVPFQSSEISGDLNPDFFYTPSTGNVVMTSDGIHLQSIVVEGPEPNQVDFLPQFWTTSYFNEKQQWFLAPGIVPWQGAERLANYNVGLDPSQTLPCVGVSFNFDGEPNSMSTNEFTNVVVDDTAPTTTMFPQDQTIDGETTYQFSAIIGDNVAVDFDSISNADFRVVGSAGYDQLASLVSKAPLPDGTVEAVYSVTAPNGSWDISDNGLYTIASVTGEACDLGGNCIDGDTEFGSFAVAIDQVAPEATADAADILFDSSSELNISVQYIDNVAIDASDIGQGDIEIVGPAGTSLVPTFVSSNTNQDSSPITSLFSYIPPDNNWDPGDNGLYEIIHRPNEVSDTNDNVVPSAKIGEFVVSIPDEVPTAFAEAEDILLATVDLQSITVTYGDDIAIDASTIDQGDIFVDALSLLVPAVPVFESRSSDADSPQLTGAYSLRAPGDGVWDETDNGTYTIFVNENAVFDVNGNAVPAGPLGTFEVDVPMGNEGLFVDLGTNFGVGGRNIDVDLGDLDSDGDLDAFVTDILGSEQVWINDGTGVFDMLDQDLGDDTSVYAALADLDNDGDLDAVVAANSEVVVWRNNGNAEFSLGSRVAVQRAWDVALDDLNGDGQIDAYVVQNGHPDLVLFNDGFGNLFNSGQSLGTDENTRGVELADLNGDDHLDAIAAISAGGMGTIQVWMNNGSGEFSNSGQSLGTAATHGAAGDIDGDSDQDIVSTDGSIWLNDGSGEFTSSGNDIPPFTTGHVAMGDFDEDGDLDIYQSNYGPADRVYLNEGGTGVFVDSGLRLGNEVSEHVALGDIDSDGDLDAFVATFSSTQSNQIYFNTTLPMEDPLDLHLDGFINGDDIDYICLAIENGVQDPRLDLDGNGAVSSTDYSLYLDLIGTKLGDANLSGSVDVSDFALWNSNKFTSNDASLPGVGWATADFNCDGVTDVSDFGIWNANKFTFAFRSQDGESDFESEELTESDSTILTSEDGRLGTSTSAQMGIPAIIAPNSNLDRPRDSQLKDRDFSHSVLDMVFESSEWDLVDV